ncbi:hypothetical protein [Mycolicibacterium goodii]
MKFAVTAVLIGMAALGTAGQASAHPRPDDAECIVAPYLTGCDGSGVPTGPEMPAGAGDPFAGPAATPPPIGSGLPGSLNTDGMPFGSAPIPQMPPPMPGGISGMPGTI